MVWNKDWLRNCEHINNRGILLGDGNKMFATHRGTLVFRTPIRNYEKEHDRFIFLRDVLYVPDVHSNLLSCSKLCDNGFRINFGREQCIGMKNGSTQFQGKRCQGVYNISVHPVHGLPVAFSAGAEPLDTSDRDGGGYRMSGIQLWHARLGHANVDSIKLLIRTGSVSGLKLNPRKSLRSSGGSCVKGKQTRQVLRRNNSRSQERGAVVHTDVCGPMSVASFSGARYFVSFVDEYTGYINIVPIQRKSDVLAQLKLFHVWWERKFACIVKGMHSDSGGEYLALWMYLEEKGIEHTKSPPYSPNQNGIAERADRTIVECSRTMLEHASLPRKFWAEAVVHAARIRNHFFCPRDRSKTSHEMLTGQIPDVAYFRVFGCLGWYHVPKERRKKLDPRSEMGIVIGCL